MLEKVGAPAVLLLVAWSVLGTSPRTRAAALLAALGLTPVLLLGDVWNTSQLHAARDRPAVALAVLVVAVVAVAGGAALFTRHPTAFPVAVAAVLPFRIPLTLGGETANLLVPLYVVIAAGALAHVVALLRADVASPEMPRPRAPERLLFAFVVLYGLQAAYSSDVSQAVQNVGFFYVPFGILYALLVDTPWSERLLATCLAVMTLLALGFCAIAFLQEATHTVLLNDKLKDSNTYNVYFRANSLFFDPNILGRFLVVVALLVAPIAAWSANRRQAGVAAAVLIVLWAGLLTTLSQSSFGALAVGILVLAAVRGGGRRLALVTGVAVAAGAVLVLAFPGVLGLQLDEAGSVRRATSGRSELVSGGADLFARRPIVGWGAGAFATEYRRETGRRSARDVAASHTIPLTVAVEQGIVGLLLYAALLAATFATLLRRAREALPAAAIVAAFAAIVFHTFGYAAFLEDPLTWALLAVGVALAGAQRSSRATSLSPTSRNSV